MKKKVIALTVAAMLLPGLAFAGSATDAALGLGAFAVFNQILGGVGLFPHPVVAPVVAPPPVAFVPAPRVVVGPPPVVYQTPVVYQRPVVYQTPVVYQRPVIYETPVVYRPYVVHRAHPVVYRAPERVVVIERSRGDHGRHERRWDR